MTLAHWLWATGATLLLAAACHHDAPPSDPARAGDTPTKTLVVPQPSADPGETSEPEDAQAATPERATRSYVTASGLRIEELRTGSGAIAEAGRRVRLHYVGTLTDGTVFDSSRARNEPMEIDIGKGHLIKGFEEGVLGMRVGDVRRLTIPPDLGYGDRRVGDKIPANSILVFEVELLEVR